ncbi:hypothetical protein [Pontixanthobacter aquaemixtae]|uniref:Uncharacterized protein n=1 Tax=Pontixanthobacter aquaemixtae TaxID=1958940 RepID=A0A844ZXI1_9SPHN|nr:hypothetical protein [Pontixanthobacter aquaemixtae]MXO91942.1 hypothetical protein [Pontixanthobacter aquaemixtae]
MSKQLSISAHASALALVLLALVGAAGELREARMEAGLDLPAYAVSVLTD